MISGTYAMIAHKSVGNFQEHRYGYEPYDPKGE